MNSKRVVKAPPISGSRKKGEYQRAARAEIKRSGRLHMTSIKIEYPGDLREKVDDFAFSLPGWWASGYSFDEDARDHAIDVPTEAIADAIASVLTVFGDDIQVTYRA